jgi:outer membrane protein OmpA-like peptidoglycan-associated protein
MKFILFLLFFLCCLTGISQQKKQYELYFDSGNGILTSSAKKTIDSLFNKTSVLNISHINIYGYCDSVGNFDYNYKLSIKRANSVKNYITKKGVILDSIFIKGYGKTIQKYNSNTWDKNRRVYFEIYFNNNPFKKNVVNIIKPAPVDTAKSEIGRFVEESKVGDKMALKNISFYGGTPELRPESKETLEELITTLKENPTIEIFIEGHICCADNDDENLSGQRATTIYNILAENGISKRRLSRKGFGHTQPLTLERDENERQMNRRVEIRIVKK